MADVHGTPDQVTQVADRLETAARTGLACPPVRDLLGTGDIARAYAVQAELTSRRERDGARRVGWKVGLTNPAVQHQLRVDQPDFGVLFADMQVRNGVLDPGRLLAPRIEAEVAVTLGADLDDEAEIANEKRLRQAVDSVLPALEIVDSRIVGWDITITDTVADNASSGAFVLGQPTALGGAELLDVPMTMFRNGKAVSSGTGADSLGDPLAALAWLARTALRLGTPLRAGDLVLTGALGCVVALDAGARYDAEFGWLGEVGVAVAGRSKDERSAV
jgi:2-keto-4-pentenoate hydratase